MAWLEHCAEVNGQDWHPVSTPAFAATGCMVAVICFLANTGERWVFLLDSANLAFHEAGHPIFGLILGERTSVYAPAYMVAPSASSPFRWRQER